MNVVMKNVSGTGKGFVLKDINLEIREGYLTGLVGKNGAGKTTLFKYLVDPGIAYEGEILLDGDPDAIKNREAMDRIAYVSEDVKYIMNKTANENATLYGTLYEQFDRELFKEYLRKMEVPGGTALGSLSRGEYLKFQLAFAIAHGSKLYLLDEVTAGMDPIFRKDYFRMLHEILKEEDVAILMSSHIEEEVEQHMDYVAVMENGSIVTVKECQA